MLNKEQYSELDLGQNGHTPFETGRVTSGKIQFYVYKKRKKERKKEREEYHLNRLNTIYKGLNYKKKETVE